MSAKVLTLGVQNAVGSDEVGAVDQEIREQIGGHETESQIHF